MSDYPTEKQLRTIRNWNGTTALLWQYVKVLWHYPDWGINESIDRSGTHLLELHTAGWSGNEDIIAALEKSKAMFFAHFHTKWERGGHYWFEVPENMWDCVTNPEVKQVTG